MQIKNWLSQASSKLELAGIESARLDCSVLLETVLEKDRSWLKAHDDDEIDAVNIAKLNDFITQRESRIPLAYILGSKEFYGRTFFVDQSVLIPRPESEAIIDIAKEVAENTEINTIIDLGTGSGCLDITLKKELPDVHVSGVDISSDSLKVAQKNARFHKTQIQWKQMNLEEKLPSMPKTRPYVFVANLPYVPDGLITSQEITKEPSLALFSGQDGLDHYRKLWQLISSSTNKPFAVITESLTSQHRSLPDLAAKSGYKLSKTTDLVQLFYKKSA